MSALRTQELHQIFLNSLASVVLWHSDIHRKPLDINLKLPHPPRIRGYLYNLVKSSGIRRRNEYKIVLRVPRQIQGEYGSFEYPVDRLVILCGYREDLNIFVFWDAYLHQRFKWGGNIQIKSRTVFEALLGEIVIQSRNLTSGHTELVLATPACRVLDCLQQRLEASILGR